MTFSVGGLASGLDTKSIISQLMSIESRPKLQLEWKSQLWTARKNAWNDLNGRLLTLQNAANALLRTETWNAASGTAPWTATSGDPTKLTATVTGTPTAGTYGVDVLQLARGEISTSTGTLPSPTSGTWSTGAWYEGGGGDVVEGDEAITALRRSNGQNMNFDIGSKITMNYTVNGVAQSAVFTVNTAGAGGNGTTLADFTTWVSSTIGNGATASFSGGALQVVTAPGTAAELDALGFSAVNSGGTALTRFNGETSAAGTMSASASDGGLSAADTLTIANGSGSWNVALAAGDSMQAIVDKINATSGIGVSAALVGGAIELRSVDTGAASAFTVSSVGGAAASLGFVENQAAQDASYTVNGTAYSSATNTNVTGAIAGVSLDLLGLTSTTLEVAENTAATAEAQTTWVNATKAKIQEFVTAYNTVLDFVHTKTQGESRVPNPKNLQEYLTGPMSRDVRFSSVSFDLRRIATESVQGLPTAANMLSQIGIETQFSIGGGGANGKLQINDAELDAALRADPAQVQAVLANIGPGTGISPEDGIVRRISEQVSLLRVGGRVDTALSGASAQIKSIQESIDRQSQRLERREAYYEKMFSSLESVLGRMQSQNAWVASQFAQMSGGGGGF